MATENSIGSLVFARLKQFWEILIPPKIPLQAKILKITSLITIFGCLTATPFNIAINMPLQINLIMMLCALGSIWLFIKLPLNSHYNRSGLILILIDLCTLALNWFPNGGSHSSTPYFVMLLICIEAVLLTGPSLVLGVFLTILMMIILFVMEIAFPHWLPPQTEPFQAQMDILFAVIFLSIVFAWVISFMLKVYKQQFERAEQASEAKSLFLSQLSHELLTPLNSVLGFSGQLIKKSDQLPPEKQLVYAKTIQSNGQHLLSLVNQILDISAMETGKIKIFWHNVNLSQMLTEIKDVVSIDAHNKQLAYHLDMPTQVIQVHSDPNRLRQILINVINNAIKYTSQGSVSCSLKPQKEGVAIEISDTGPGIPQEQHKQIFEPFVRMEAHRQIPGNGLGLSLTQTLCEHLGCKIALKSSSDKGSVFTIWVPYQKPSP